ncbi:hypothetical protein BB778_03925 [Pluralibacter gergoviae]|uniref:DUF456 domain-containing protein n=1 Tax=Pluralibacter gergoviae TaxID=61647 RepID=UPI0008DC1DB7|nr:DUF456 domain-containing protein [Pluralibacter gergoviae]OHY63784.1 hypothetical protein BB778_03925 [Pluralibacter gergoviae]
MANIKVHYANFPYQEITTAFGVISIKSGALQIKGESITGDKLLSLDICTESTVKKIGGALGWGVVGGMLVGPAGIIAGAFLGGNKKDITFVAEFKDGRKFMGTTDSQAYTKLTSSKMKYDDILSVSQEGDEEDYTPTYDEEMMTKANRMYKEPDYMEWKKRTGEADIIMAWMEKTGYCPPGYKE